MRERSTKYTTGAARSAVLEAGYGGARLRPLLFALAALALALAMALLVRPGVAVAAPSPFVDDTTANFQAGTTDANTQVDPDFGNGAVTLNETQPTVQLNENFDGTSLPTGWSETQWNAGSGSATVEGGELTLDGVQVQSPNAYGPERSLEFAATFREGTFQNIGFATSFAGEANDTWAAFGEGGTAGQLLARVKLPNAPTVDVNVGAPGQYIGTEHVYRIEWTSTEVRYLVDGNLVHTQPATITDEMRVSASDFPVGGNNPSVDYFRVSTLPAYPASGVFTSRVFEANGRSNWETLTAETEEPTGTDITFETRSGNTEAALQTATWRPVADDGTIASPNGKYIQYRATLTTTAASATPVLERVEITFDDVQGPTITSYKPTGRIADRTPRVTALVRDETTNLAKTDIRLYVDGREKTGFTYNAATDRLTYDSGRLAYGPHTVRIEATDEAGNTTERTWGFRIAKRR